MTAATPSFASRIAAPLRWRSWGGLLRRRSKGRHAAARPSGDAPETLGATRTTAAGGDGCAPQTIHNWPQWRIDLMERLWGKGFLLPGGTDFVQELTKPLNLNPKASVLVLGAGMGAPANIIAQQYGAFIDGIEPDQELAEASAKRAAVVKGMSRVTIKNLAIDDDAAYARKYDAIFGQEVLLRRKDRADILMRCANALKSNGKLVLTDFTLTADGDAAGLAAWFAREHAEAPPLNEDEMRALHKTAGFRIRTVEDMSDHYISLILKGWAALEQSLRATTANRDTLLVMIGEAERWAQRVALLQANQICYTRFFATKMSNV